MTVKEAINVFKAYRNDFICNLITGKLDMIYDHGYERTEAINIAIPILGKHVPMHPVNINICYKDSPYPSTYLSGYCVVCGAIVTNEQTYCCKCGQLLNWKLE